MTNREWIKVAPADLRQGDETPDYVVSGHMRHVKDHPEHGEILMVAVTYRDGGRAERFWDWDQRTRPLVSVAVDVGALLEDAELGALARLDRLPDALRADALERLAASLNDRARAARCDLEAPQA